MPCERLAPDEIRLPHVHHKTESRLHRRIGIVDVHTEVPVTLLESQTLEGHQSAVHGLHALILDTLDQRVIDGVAVLGGYVELVAQFAHEGNSHEPYSRAPEFHLAARAEGDARCRQIR